MLQFSEMRLPLFKKSDSARVKILQISERVLFSLLFAGFTGLCARLRIYLPFTPVPVTGQVFAVLLSGFILAKGYGSLSQMLYVGLGLLGIPWFVVGAIGPTGGYIVGFVTAPYLIATLLERRHANTSILFTFFAASCGVMLIYLFGSIQFMLFTGMRLGKTLLLAVLPFIPFDIVKAAAASACSYLLVRMAGKRAESQSKT